MEKNIHMVVKEVVELLGEEMAITLAETGKRYASVEAEQNDGCVSAVIDGEVVTVEFVHNSGNRISQAPAFAELVKAELPTWAEIERELDEAYEVSHEGISDICRRNGFADYDDYLDYMYR